MQLHATAWVMHVNLCYLSGWSMRIKLFGLYIISTNFINKSNQ